MAAWRDGEEVDLAHRTLAHLEKFGITISPRSRLIQAKETLEKAQRFQIHFGPDDPSTEEWVAEAKRTIIELSFITAALASRADELRERFKKILGGPAVPVVGQQDKARDTQAELLVAAALAVGGYDVAFSEPDLVVQDFMGSTVGLAIKRVTSPREDQIEKRLRQARDQLTRNELRGLVVVNAERALARVYYSNRGADLSAELFRKVTRWLDYVHGRDSLMRVVGVVGVATSIRLVRQTQSFDLRLHFNPRFLIAQESETQTLRERAKELSLKIAEGLQRIAQAI